MNSADTVEGRKYSRTTLGADDDTHAYRESPDENDMSAEMPVESHTWMVPRDVKCTGSENVRYNDRNPADTSVVPGTGCNAVNAGNKNASLDTVHVLAALGLASGDAVSTTNPASMVTVTVDPATAHVSPAGNATTTVCCLLSDGAHVTRS